METKKGKAKLPTMNIFVGEVRINDTGDRYSVPVEITIHPIDSFFSKIEIKDGVEVIAVANTDNEGKAVFNLKGDLSEEEITKTFRVRLIGVIKEGSITISLPAKKNNVDLNNPETLTAYRYHDKHGNFRVLVRVLGEKGLGNKFSFSTWFKGERKNYTTDKHGFRDFSLPHIQRGENEKIIISADGIEENASLRVDYPEEAINFKDRDNWLITTNNGRAIIALAVVAIFWLVLFFSINVPLISPHIFNAHPSLTPSEAFYGAAPTTTLSNHFVDNIIIVGILFSIFSIIYFILSWREEVMAGIEEGIEAIINKDSNRVSDPRLERWMNHFGMISRARTSTINVHNVGAGEEGKEKDKKSGHPSLGTLFQLDLISDALVEILPRILKKIFN